MAKRNDADRPAKLPVQMAPEKAIDLLQGQIDQIAPLAALSRKNDSFTPWQEKTFSILRLLFGEPSAEIERFKRIDFDPRVYYHGMPESDYQRTYERGFKDATAVLESIKFEYRATHMIQNDETRHETIATSAPRSEARFYFVAHDFSAGQLDDLRKAIQEALRDSGLEPYFADKEGIEGQILLSKILPKIAKSRFGIYDISAPEKPNVFIELGAAIAIESPYYIIARKGTPIPSDLQGLDRIEY